MPVDTVRYGIRFEFERVGYEKENSVYSFIVFLASQCVAALKIRLGGTSYFCAHKATEKQRQSDMVTNTDLPEQVRHSYGSHWSRTATDRCASVMNVFCMVLLNLTTHFPGCPVQQAGNSRQDEETECWVGGICLLTGARRLFGQGHCHCLSTVRTTSYGWPNWNILTALNALRGWRNAFHSVVGNFSSNVFSSYSVLTRRFHDLRRSSLLNGAGSW